MKRVLILGGFPLAYGVIANVRFADVLRHPKRMIPIECLIGSLVFFGTSFLWNGFEIAFR